MSTDKTTIDKTTTDDVGQAHTMAGASEAYCSLCEGSFPAGTTICPADGTRLVQFADQHDRLLGKRIDSRFEVLSKLGQGGMGDVYRAKQTSIGREVAIKVIKGELSADRIACKRFLREAKLLSRVTHPNVVVVHDMGQDADGTLYLVMELVTGKTLAELLLDDPAMPAARIRDISLQVCDALEAAHGLGIIHRDLKPANILVSTSASGRDTVKVLDFGLAKSLVGDDTTGNITGTGLVMGTPLYISPEMITGGEVDGRADLYSLGCLIYEMCSGTPPFMAETATLLMTKHVTDEPAPILRADVLDLYRVTQTLLRKKPSDRPADAATVSRLLAIETGVVPTPPPGALASPATALSSEGFTSPDGPATPNPASAAVAAATDSADRLGTQIGGKKSVRRVGFWVLGLGVVGAAAAFAFRGGSGEDESNGPSTSSQAVATNSTVADAAVTPSVSPGLPTPLEVADAGVELVSLTLDSVPSADEIYLDGESLGAGPATIEVPASAQAHLLEFHKEGYVVRKSSLAASQDVTRTDFALQALAKTKGARKGRPKKPKLPKDKPKLDEKPKPDEKPKVEFFTK